MGTEPVKTAWRYLAWAGTATAAKATNASISTYSTIPWPRTSLSLIFLFILPHLHNGRKSLHAGKPASALCRCRAAVSLRDSLPPSNSSSGCQLDYYGLSSFCGHVHLPFSTALRVAFV